MKTGKIIQVLGPVVDVSFEDEELPAIKDALEVKNGDKKCIMEVAQHIGNHTVRCIMLASSEGLCRDMEVTATGSGIKTPVGEQTLGRLNWDTRKLAFLKGNVQTIRLFADFQKGS